MEHTPGPWNWGDGWNAIDKGGSMYSSDGEGNPHIEKYMDLQLMGGTTHIIPLRIDHYSVGYDGDPITPADRALIAAAPELLAALKVAQDVLSKTRLASSDQNPKGFRDLIGAAIAKASIK